MIWVFLYTNEIMLFLVIHINNLVYFCLIIMFLLEDHINKLGCRA